MLTFLNNAFSVKFLAFSKKNLKWPRYECDKDGHYNFLHFSCYISISKKKSNNTIDIIKLEVPLTFVLRLKIKLHFLWSNETMKNCIINYKFFMLYVTFNDLYTEILHISDPQCFLFHIKSNSFWALFAFSFSNDGVIASV